MIEKWCHFTGTPQDHPDVCLFSHGAIDDTNSDKAADCNTLPDLEDEDSIFAYYEWYEITNSITGASVFRRMRRASFSEGYPNNCIIMNPHTSYELGLIVPDIYNVTDEVRRERFTHYRSRKINLAERRFPKGYNLGIDSFIADKDGRKTLYQITGLPVYPIEDQSLVVRPVSEGKVIIKAWQTTKHPDYAIRIASRIANVSLTVAFVSLILCVVSIFL